MAELKIILADDHAVVRQGVKQILAGAFPSAVFGEAYNAHDLLTLVRQERWDIAAGYLNKEGAPEELVLALRKIVAGGNYISEAVADELVLHSRQESDRPLHELLSDREYQVLCLIASGKAVKAIGAELSLSPTTVSTYRVRILQKMGMTTSAQLMQYAIQNRLVLRS